MNISGLIKTTLLDYPEHIACTIFLNGCNFLCPFCHNKDLVLKSNTTEDISLDNLLSFLNKRSSTLEGVCITGGEPTLRKDLPNFIRTIRELNLKIKLDTNGYNPDMLDFLLKEKLLDYVAMDIKNCKEKYSHTVGLSSMELAKIERSVNILLNCNIDYEFRTTVVKEFHTTQDMIGIAKWIGDKPKYFLQCFVPNDNQLQAGFSAYSSSELHNILSQVSVYTPKAKLRGI